MQQRRTREPTSNRTLSAAVAVLLTLVSSACATAAGPPPTATPAATAAVPRESPSLRAPSSPSLAATDALVGTWDTGPYRTTETEGHDTLEWRVRFYEED